MDQMTMIEPHIVVGFDRRITVPSSLKRIAVQYDHNVETVTFDCPRTWDGNDFLDQRQYAIYVNLMAPDGSLFSDPVTNVVEDADPAVMHFDWTVKNYVTQEAGGIQFLICIKRVNELGLEINHWNSELCKDLYVSAGLECSETESDLTPDLVTKVLLAIDKFEGTDYSQIVDRLEIVESKAMEQGSEVELLDEAIQGESSLRSSEDAKLRQAIVDEMEHRTAADEALNKRIDNAQDEATSEIEGSIERLHTEFKPTVIDITGYRPEMDLGTGMIHAGVSAKCVSGFAERYVDGRFRMRGTLKVLYSNYPAATATNYFIDYLLRRDEIAQMVFGNSTVTMSEVNGFWHGILNISHADGGHIIYTPGKAALANDYVLRFVCGGPGTIVNVHELKKDFSIYFDIYGQANV